MKRVVLLVVVAGALSGCATQAQREVSRMQGESARGEAAVTACDAKVKASPEYQFLKPKVAEEGASLSQQADPAKATPEQIRAIYAVHAAIGECRKIRLEAANAINPTLVAPLASGYARADAAYVGLVEGKSTWGQFNREMEATRAEVRSQLSAATSQIQRGLDQSHTAEVARRQQAAAALSTWSYQQQVLYQNQQMINAMNAPRMTNCQYVGPQLSCTTF